MRTFHQFGKIFGTDSGHLQVWMDSTQIVDKTIEPHCVSMYDVTPADDHYSNWPTLFTWQLPVEFEGTKEIEIRITGADLYLGQTLADHAPNHLDDELADFYSERTVDDTYVVDPFKDVIVNDRMVHRDGTITGQWHHIIFAYQKFTATLNVNKGKITLPWSDDREYQSGEYVLYEDQVYRANQIIPAGTIPQTPSRLWALIPPFTD